MVVLGSQGLPHPLYRPTKQKVVICKEPICSAVPSSQIQRCVRPTDQCDYQIEYADAASSLGVLVRDAVTLRLTNGSLLQPRVAFGYSSITLPKSFHSKIRILMVYA